jgi:inorganic pyrophosphatase
MLEVSIMNVWKDIPAGDKPPELLNMVVEVIMGSRDKYEYYPPWESFVLDRIIPSSVVFPVDLALSRKHGLTIMTRLT